LFFDLTKNHQSSFRFSVDATVLRVDDIYQRETQNRLILQNLDCRLQRLEDMNTNMYGLIEKILINQSFDEQKYVRSPLSLFDDGRLLQRRRFSTLTAYDLTARQQEFNRLSMTNLRSSASERTSTKRTPHRLRRRSTIQRLNSTNSNDINFNQIQSNEYTSITDS